MIEAHNLTKIYSSTNGQHVVLDDTSFSIPPGEFLAIVGRSGSGKTTLLNLIGALDVPTSGVLRFEGVHLEAMSDAERSHFRNAHIGFIFQAFVLQARRSAMDNVMLPLVIAGVPLTAARKRALEALAEVGLDRYARVPVHQLSGGQQQRVAIARAIANRPKLLLADEPTGNLDTHTSLEIFELLSRYREEHGTTIVVVTHDPLVETFHLAKWTICDGKVIAYDGPV